ncbi:MAG TPA: hypothetical protein VF899_03435 [Pyrinomonadaceae bacterium]
MRDFLDHSGLFSRALDGLDVNDGGAVRDFYPKRVILVHSVLTVGD